MNWAFWIAILIMIVGLVGSVFPLLPGPPIVWLGALFYAVQTHFAVVGWITLVGLALLAIAAVSSDFWIAALGNRQAGASGWATLFSTIGGMIGLFTFGLPGMLIGSLLGVLLPEWRRWRDTGHIMKMSGRTLKNWLVSTLVQSSLSLLMIIVFVVRVLLD